MLRIISPEGQRAVTHYEVVRQLSRGTLLHIRLDTGRTHQIRVHMSHIGHPLFGDFLYGKEEPELISRQALHSYELSFVHPLKDEQMNFALDMPKDMQELVQKLA